MIAVVMGVSGCGKTTVARGVAERKGWLLLEGDAFHPPASVAKMHAGVPLSDEDRWPCQQAIAHEIDTLRDQGNSAGVACSALIRPGIISPPLSACSGVGRFLTSLVRCDRLL